MLTLKQAIQQAEDNNIALGHFNISTIEAIWAIVESAVDLNQPIVVGVSEGERDFVGIKELRSIINDIRESTNHPIFLNADHTYSLDRIKEVVEAGYDSVIYDGAKLGVEENTKNTKEVVDYVKSVNPQILVEAELGYIGTSSALLDEIPENATTDSDGMPTGSDAKEFVQKTRVDLLSPAVGNIHGMLKNAQNPKLNIERIKEIRTQGGVSLVLHGGSGIADQDFVEAIQAGIAMVHINTEIRVAWRDGIRSVFDSNPDEVAPYKILKPAKEGMKQVITRRLKLFTNQ